MGAIEVLPEFGDGNIKVEGWVSVEESSDEVDEQTVGRVLIGSQLHFHRAELHSPTNIIVHRNFETN